MPSDKHFDPPSTMPEALQDHQPDDMPAARSIGIVILCLLVVGAIIAVVIYGRVNHDKDTTDPAQREVAR